MDEPGIKLASRLEMRGIFFVMLNRIHYNLFAIVYVQSKGIKADPSIRTRSFVFVPWQGNSYFISLGSVSVPLTIPSRCFPASQGCLMEHVCSERTSVPLAPLHFTVQPFHRRDSSSRECFVRGCKYSTCGKVCIVVLTVTSVGLV